MNRSGRELELLIKDWGDALENPFPYPVDHIDRIKAERQIRIWEGKLKDGTKNINKKSARNL